MHFWCRSNEAVRSASTDVQRFFDESSAGPRRGRRLSPTAEPRALGVAISIGWRLISPFGSILAGMLTLLLLIRLRGGFRLLPFVPVRGVILSHVMLLAASAGPEGSPMGHLLYSSPVLMSSGRPSRENRPILAANDVADTTNTGDSWGKRNQALPAFPYNSGVTSQADLGPGTPLGTAAASVSS
jgi:hypothetical protein